MYSLIVLTIVALVLSLSLTPLLRDWSIRAGWVDRPDGRRKTHTKTVPRTGGLPILLSYAGSFAILLALPLRAGDVLRDHLGMIGSLLPPVAIVFFSGLLDDWLDLHPWQKLAGEICAATWVWAAGVRIAGPAELGGPWSSMLLTVGWLVLCSNAFNLIDGVDGLAAGVGLTATLTTLTAGVLHGDITLGLATAPLAGCLVGFLCYNFNPASIFLGDSGSLLIGFLLGCYSIIWSHTSATLLGMAAPALALSLPIVEVGLSVARRFVRNEPIFAGDRGHIHHQLLDRGWAPRHVALLLYGVCGVAAVLSLVQSLLHGRFAGLAIGSFGVIAWFGVSRLGYAEFDAARRFLLRAFRPMLGAHVKLELLERSLASAGSVEECWRAIEQTGRSLGYSHISARLGTARFATAPGRERNSSFWQFRLNLGGDSWVNITQSEGAAGQPILLVPFTDSVRRVLPERLAALKGPLGGFRHASLRNSSTTTVMSSDCGASSVNAATAS